MVDLVTLDEVKERLAITFSSQDAKIAGIVDEATGIVLDYIDQPDPAWTVETVPFHVRAAIMLVTARLYAGDDKAVLTDAVKGILRRTRRPVVA